MRASTEVISVVGEVAIGTFNAEVEVCCVPEERSTFDYPGCPAYLEFQKILSVTFDVGREVRLNPSNGKKWDAAMKIVEPLVVAAIDVTG